MYHVKCSNHQLNQNASNKAYEWTCPNCIHTALPFYNKRNLDFDSTVTDETTILRANNCHIETLKNYQKYTFIAHINCQSILSTFDEFAVMLKSYEFDIISLSKTWLTNNQDQLDYVNIASYKSIFKHRSDKRGGSVGFYIKDNISFKTLNDLTKNIVNMEVAFIELHGRNKNTPYLVAVAYQPSPYESDKLLWLQNFETLLNEVTSKWDDVIIITGDINIDLIGEQKESSKRYENILYLTFISI